MHYVMTKARSRHDEEWERARAAARLAACLALYEMEFAGKGVEAVIADFRDNRFAEALPLEGDNGAPQTFDWGALDEDHFQAVVRSAVRDQSRIDEEIRGNLAKGWRFSRIDSTSRAILRAGVSELLDMPAIPAKAIIDSYVEIAKSFFDDETPAFVNGVLDSVGSKARAAELSRQ
ncbi:MAG: transcription antitermination factor NusB [Parvularculaceae bacterium]